MSFAFGVDDDEQAAGLGVVDDVGERPRAEWAELFEEGGLRFHDRDKRGDDVDDAVAEADRRRRGRSATRRWGAVAWGDSSARGRGRRRRRCRVRCTAAAS